MSQFDCMKDFSSVWKLYGGFHLQSFAWEITEYTVTNHESRHQKKVQVNNVLIWSCPNECLWPVLAPREMVACGWCQVECCCPGFQDSHPAYCVRHSRCEWTQWGGEWPPLAFACCQKWGWFWPQRVFTISKLHIQPPLLLWVSGGHVKYPTTCDSYSSLCLCGFPSDKTWCFSGKLLWKLWIFIIDIN